MDKWWNSSVPFSCVVSWVASIIIEFKLCKILVSFCKYGSQLSRYDVWTLPKAKVQLVIFVVSAIVTLNACWMMLQFSNAVYKSFEMLTSDPWLLMYYLMAAAAKNCRVFLQGMSCSYGIEHKTQGYYSQCNCKWRAWNCTSTPVGKKNQLL